MAKNKGYKAILEGHGSIQINILSELILQYFNEAHFVKRFNYDSTELWNYSRKLLAPWPDIQQNEWLASSLYRKKAFLIVKICKMCMVASLWSQIIV